MAGGAPKAARYRRKGTPADPRSLTATRSYMVDGLSPARQPASGLAATLLAMVWERPWTGFFLFAAAHAAIWTILPFTLYPNLPLDLIEALTYGREWQLGYDKLPPLPWWLVEIAYRTVGHDVAYYVLAQVAVVLAFVAVWLTARELVGAVGALVAVLVLDGLHYFHFTAAKFNHDVIQLPLWALAGYV